MSTLLHWVMDAELPSLWRWVSAAVLSRQDAAPTKHLDHF
jgi:hypothetical protein